MTSAVGGDAAADRVGVRRVAAEQAAVPQAAAEQTATEPPAVGQPVAQQAASHGTSPEPVPGGWDEPSGWDEPVRADSAGYRSDQDWHAAAHEASRLVAFGLRARLVPARDAGYGDLVRRCLDDPSFADLAATIAAGLGLVVLDVSERAGIVLAGAEDSAFTVRMSDYSRRAGGEHRAAERLLHALAHLAVAALAFPRPADLTDESFVGRVGVDGVDAFVREACRLLDERTADSDPGADLGADFGAVTDTDTDVNADTEFASRSTGASVAGASVDVQAEAEPPAPGTLEAAWRLYGRRTATGATRDARRLAGSTTGIVARAMSFLAESGCLVPVSDEGGGTYRTTARYQVQVRELAADAALEELLALGIVTVTDGVGSVRVLPAAATLPGTGERNEDVPGV